MSVEIAPAPECVRAAVEPREPKPRADIAAIGVGLATLVLVAWLTALPYLSVRVGLPSPVRLAVVDVVHVYVGLASVVFIVAKVARIGFGLRVVGVAPPLVWHRWLSWSLGVLYTAVYVTGVLTLPQWPAGVRTQLVNAHLIASVWAAVPTTWHVWHHRGLAAPLVPRPRTTRRFVRMWVALGALCVSAVAIGVAAPRALAPLTEAGAGGTWRDTGPRTFVDRMEASPRGDQLVAGGDGLYVSQDSGRSWRVVPGFSGLNYILGLTLPGRGPVAAFVGTAAGLYSAPDVAGPYRRVPIPAGTVHGIAVDPSDSNVIWASSDQGFLESSDSGHHWRAQVAGLRDQSAWALVYFRGQLLGSVGSGVYRWTGASWAMASNQRYVVSFTASQDGRLFASSMGDGIEVTTDGRVWHSSDAGIATHAPGGDSFRHVVSVTVRPDGTAYAGTMLDGVAVSLDSGSTWSPVWSGLRDHGDVWRVLVAGDQMVAATDQGIVTYQLLTVASAGTAWWIGVCAMALLVGIVALRVTVFPPRRSSAATHSPLVDDAELVGRPT